MDLGCGGTLSMFGGEAIGWISAGRIPVTTAPWSMPGFLHAFFFIRGRPRSSVAAAAPIPLG
eukprot:8821037-Lingulodinium_polyedra.AAC.1